MLPSSGSGTMPVTGYGPGLGELGAIADGIEELSALQSGPPESVGSSPVVVPVSPSRKSFTPPDLTSDQLAALLVLPGRAAGGAPALDLSLDTAPPDSGSLDSPDPARAALSASRRIRAGADAFLRAWEETAEAGKTQRDPRVVLGKKVAPQSFDRLMRMCNEAIEGVFSEAAVLLAVERCGGNLEDYIDSLKSIRDDRTIPPRVRAQVAQMIIEAPMWLVGKIKAMRAGEFSKRPSSAGNQITSPASDSPPNNDAVAAALSEIRGTAKTEVAL